MSETCFYYDIFFVTMMHSLQNLSKIVQVTGICYIIFPKNVMDVTYKFYITKY